MTKTTLDAAFESLAVAFLAQHPTIPHEWRDVTSRWWGGVRRDLICAPGQKNEVFASLKGTQIALGITSGDHEDFEDFGRSVSDEEVAREAFDRFVEVLSEAGHLDPQPNVR
jgi:hypothetical protein